MTMSAIHDQVEAYVLSALDASDRQRFEFHLAECATCQYEVASYVPVLSALREMPLPEAPKFRSPRRHVAFSPRALMAAAAAALFTIGGVAGAGIHSALSDDMVTVAAMGVTSAEEVRLRGDGVQGRAIVGAARRRTAFVVAGLPEAGPNQTYQVWVTSGATSSPGVLHRSFQGYEVLVVPGDMLRGAKQIVVTREPFGGSPRMTNAALIASGTPDV